MTRRLILSAAFLLSFLPAWGLDEALVPDIQRGLDALYALDYHGAKQAFGAVLARAPELPLGHYAMATAYWWELTNEYDEDNPDLEKHFLKAADKTIEVAKSNMDSDPLGEARLSLGGALGLKSRWEAIQGHWVRAYFDGKAAYNAQAEAVKINPKLYDAYLGLGIFHYYTATLPSVVRVLAKVVRIRGDKAEGLREINLAVRDGFFSKTAAKLFLVGIYNNTEKKYGEALKLVREMRGTYPESSFFHLLEMLTLENAGEWEALKTQARDYISCIESGKSPSYRKNYLHRGYFSLANATFGEGNPREALGFYDKTLTEFDSEDRWISWAYLNRGKAHDALGEREKAVADYKAVLKRRDVWQLHDLAKEGIRRPYKGLKEPQ